jgi:hypothetical protein
MNMKQKKDFFVKLTWKATLAGGLTGKYSYE